MAKRAGPAPPARVKQVRERIEQWRQTRRRRTAMPVELWGEAVALATSNGPYRVARALRIDFGGLRRRMAEAALGSRAVPALRSSGFVELTGAQILGAAPTMGTVVEVEDGGGMRLVVRMAKEVPVDVAQWVSAFRSGA